MNLSVGRLTVCDREIVELVLRMDPEASLVSYAAKRIHQEDIRANKTLGDFGAKLLE